MGNFSNNAITDVGRMLLADVHAGAVFTPTRIVIGSGSMPGGATAQSMTEVITPVKSLAINKKRRSPDGKCVFGGVYTNEEVTEPFYFRELALYAKAVYYNTDGSVKSESAEALYSYGNAGATADYMPAYSTSTVVEKQMDLVVWVGNDAQVDLTIESGLYVSQEAFETHASRHAKDGEDPITPESIGAAPAGFGLGGQSTFLSSSDNLNSIISNGWYSWHEDTPLNVPAAWGNMIVTSQAGHYTQTVYLFMQLGAVLQRTCVGDSWSEWEWVNPPMLPGVEYRTTERRDGRAVYKMFGTDGVLRYRLDGETEWKTYAQETGSAPAGLVHKVYDTDTDAAVDAVIEAELNNMAGHTMRHICLNDNLGDTVFFGGMAHLTIHKVTNNYATVEAIKYHTFGVLKWRRCKYTTWQPWEWENPPLDPGMVYRTTERYKGAVVYKRLAANGDILWRTENETSWRLLSAANNVYTATVE